MKDPYRSIVRRVRQPVSASTPVVPPLSPSVVYRTIDADVLDAQDNAAELAEHLATLDGVDAVFYPGREDHPDHALAVALLNGNFANMVSFRLRGARAQINAFARAAAGIPFAPTLGDIGTTLSHPASSSHRYLTQDQREKLGITEGLVRVSVGVEDIELLKRELATAIDAALKT